MLDASIVLKKKTYNADLPILHLYQQKITDSSAKRKIIRAGRRSGKTVVAASIAVDSFIHGKRPLYATPTTDQLSAFWFEVKRALAEPIEAGIYVKNETEHTIELVGTQNRLRGKTAWNADMLRGDYADLLILDEWQLMNEDTWNQVGAPMLLDNDGDAIFIYTPPTLHSRSISKARDPRHASKMYKSVVEKQGTRWAAFSFTSFDNPYISHKALEDITLDMSQLAYRQEILAEDVEEVPGALWTRELINKSRVDKYPELVRIVIGVDPPGGRTECGIIIAGLGNDRHGYILEDESLMGTPNQWANKIITSYLSCQADMILGEQNYGGDMVESTIMQAAESKGLTVRYKHVHATRGKAVRAEPVVAGFEQGRIHLVGEFPYLEEELCTWVPGESRESPNRMDALVWAITELMLQAKSSWRPL